MCHRFGEVASTGCPDRTRRISTLTAWKKSSKATRSAPEQTRIGEPTSSTGTFRPHSGPSYTTRSGTSRIGHRSGVEIRSRRPPPTQQPLGVAVRDGGVREIRTGEVQVRGTFKLESAVILERELAPIQLPGRIVLPDRRPAAPAAEAPAPLPTPYATPQAH